MALLSEYAITPDVFDAGSYTSEEVCGLHLQALKEVMLQEGLVRDLRAGAWFKTFDNTDRAWHRRGKELLKKLRLQGRLVAAPAAGPQAPGCDADWATEALATHATAPLRGIVVTDSIAASFSTAPVVSSVNKLATASWWSNRSSSLRVRRTFTEYQAALSLPLRHANSLMLVDPFIDPTDHHQYGDLMSILRTLQARQRKPLVEVHRAAWYGGGNDKRPRIADVVSALRPGLASVAAHAGVTFDVFLWDDIHDRYLISDLVGISLPRGFATTTAPDAFTTWTRLGRPDRDAVQRDFDPATRQPRHRFTIP